MHIKEFSQITKLTKKTIHFYIEENLLHPKQDEENNYYIFNDEDIQQARLICIYRKSGLPIKTIKETLFYPTLTNFFLHKQMNLLKTNIKKEIQQLENLQYLLDTISPNAISHKILDEISVSQFDRTVDTNFLDISYPNIDARMIAIILWGPFLDIVADEYRKFLWTKISNELKLHFANNMTHMQDFIYSLSSDQVENCSQHAFKLYKKISESDKEELKYFEDDLLKNLTDFMESKALQKIYDSKYETIIYPVITFLSGPAKEVMMEYNPRYNKYIHNLTIITHNVLYQLENENKSKILFQLSKLDTNGTDLITTISFLYTFQNSTYVCNETF